MRKKLEYWCTLNRASGLGSKTFLNLLATFGSPEIFFTLSDAEIRKKLPNIAEKKWGAWRMALDDKIAQADLDWWDSDENHHILTLKDSSYPSLLKEIADPPPVLFVIGDIDLLSMIQLGVVGSRQSTTGGEKICSMLCQQVSHSGLVITSGMALGIDAAAHRATLDAGGKTIAVVGTGLDRVYPAKHRDLAHSIALNGAIVSEFPIGTGVRAHHFPQRNRIISGMSAGVLVIEATEKSGSLITARHASEQGREVFAVPGSIFSPLAKGCHHLIRQGAKLTETASDILEELSPLAHATVLAMSSNNEKNEMNQIPENPTDDKAQKLLNVMGFDPYRSDDLIEKIDLTIAEISAMLLILELDGKVESLPGGRYQRLDA